MPINLTALKAALESNPRYDTAVRTGKNRVLLQLLGDLEPGQSIFRLASRDDVLEAVGDSIRTMTAVRRETLSLYLVDAQVDFRRLTTFSEIMETVADDMTAGLRIAAIASTPRTYGEAFSGEVTLRDLWAVLIQIPKSYMATKAAENAVQAELFEVDLTVMTAVVQSEFPIIRSSKARSVAITRLYA